MSDNKQLTKKDIQDVSLEILKDVASFCDEHNITYFLACGTLLGAVKYKGFIPWDDDIDIMLPRGDYDRFVKEYNSTRYKLCPSSEGRYYYAKVYDPNTIKYEDNLDYKKYYPLGVDIDLFPLDGIINDDKAVDKLYKRTCFLEMLLRLSNQPIFYRKNPLKAINRIIPRIIGSKNLVKLIERNAKTYDYAKSDYVIRMRRSTNGFTGALSKDVYDVDYLEFEGISFKVPKGYDQWLRRFYGDYEEDPPEDQRVVHPIKCYYK